MGHRRLGEGITSLTPPPPYAYGLLSFFYTSICTFFPFFPLPLFHCLGFSILFRIFPFFSCFLFSSPLNKIWMRPCCTLLSAKDSERFFCRKLHFLLLWISQDVWRGFGKSVSLSLSGGAWGANEWVCK